MSSVSAVLITTTVNSLEEAQRIAETCVEQRLAACAQISGPITSYYIWEDEQCCESEWLVSMKTMKILEQKLMKFISSMHSYETPELISVQVETVSDDYLEWMLLTLGL